MRTRFNGDCLVNNITFNTRCCRQSHLKSTHATDHTPVDHNIIGHDFAVDCRGFPDGQQMRSNIAFNRAFYLNITGRFYIADHMKILGNN